jgi:hypothetical protein
MHHLISVYTKLSFANTNIRILVDLALAHTHTHKDGSGQWKHVHAVDRRRTSTAGKIFLTTTFEIIDCYLVMLYMNHAIVQCVQMIKFFFYLGKGLVK